MRIKGYIFYRERKDEEIQCGMIDSSIVYKNYEDAKKQLDYVYDGEFVTGYMFIPIKE